MLPSVRVRICTVRHFVCCTNKRVLMTSENSRVFHIKSLKEEVNSGFDPSSNRSIKEFASEESLSTAAVTGAIAAAS